VFRSIRHADVAFTKIMIVPIYLCKRGYIVNNVSATFIHNAILTFQDWRTEWNVKEKNGSRVQDIVAVGGTSVPLHCLLIALQPLACYNVSRSGQPEVHEMYSRV
jgi:hypothetical protein